jgi:hypothetical protein
VVCKVRPLPSGADERAWTHLSMEIEESLVLMRHARCVTLPKEWLTVHHDCGMADDVVLLRLPGSGCLIDC